MEQRLSSRKVGGPGRSGCRQNEVRWRVPRQAKRRAVQLFPPIFCRRKKLLAPPQGPRPSHLGTTQTIFHRGKSTVDFFRKKFTALPKSCPWATPDRFGLSLLRRGARASLDLPRVPRPALGATQTFRGGHARLRMPSAQRPQGGRGVGGRRGGLYSKRGSRGRRPPGAQRSGSHDRPGPSVRYGRPASYVLSRRRLIQSSTSSSLQPTRPSVS